MRRLELQGKRFGKLTVLRLAKRCPKYDGVKWVCRCDCGKTIEVRASHLHLGNTQSCGCLRVIGLVERSTKHGLSKTVEYLLWQYARHRAKVSGIEFDITVDDVVIPQACPIFNTPFQRNSKVGPLPSSPSIDRFDPLRGYVKGNVWVISHRANSIKNSASYAQLKAIITAMEHAALGASVETLGKVA